MTNLVIFVLASIGFCNIMIESFIMESLRNWIQGRVYPSVYKIFTCYQCMGFWTGLICGLILISLNPLIALCCGFAGSFLSTLAATFLNYLESISIGNLGNG